MIKKTIHYCWFGKNPKNELIKKCIQSWVDIMPDYNIVEWNEENFDVNSSLFSAKAYKNKKWAFVSDYARLVALEKHGGIYLDTDMYVIKKFDDLLGCDLVLGKEDSVHISAGFIACSPDNTYIKKVREYYDNASELITIPRVLTQIYNSLKDSRHLSGLSIKVLDPVYFYPFDASNIKKFNYKNAPLESYAVHMWNYSWGHPLVKLTKSLGMHKLIINTLDKLKIKKFIKKLLRGV